MTRPKRILFLAMSGVRVYNRRLLELGLTLPGFVERSKVIAALPSLGLLTLAAYTSEDWEVAYLEIDDIFDGVVDRIHREGYRVVAISSLTARIEESYLLADRLRRHGVTVILGGLHVSALPDEAAGHADSVVCGEGELVWKQVLADWEAGRMQRIYDTRTMAAPPGHFREQPPPRYDLLEMEHYNRMTLQTTRGCPLHCEFCGASRLISPYRKKSSPQIRRELEAILTQWARPFIELADDNTFVDKTWSRELVAVLADYPVKWFTESDISLADDRELLKRVAASGCAQVLVGLESASPASMERLDTRNWKSRRHDGVRERIRILQDHGITVNGCFILGFDQDGPDAFRRTRDYIDSLDLAEVQITLLTPFPGTNLRRRLEREGRILPGTTWSQHTLFDVTFCPARMKPSELEEGFAWLMSEVYSEQRVRHRKTIIKKCIADRHAS